MFDIYFDTNSCVFDDCTNLIYQCMSEKVSSSSEVCVVEALPLIHGSSLGHGEVA